MIPRHRLIALRRKHPLSRGKANVSQRASQTGVQLSQNEPALKSQLLRPNGTGYRHLQHAALHRQRASLGHHHLANDFRPARPDALEFLQWLQLRLITQRAQSPIERFKSHIANPKFTTASLTRSEPFLSQIVRVSAGVSVHSHKSP